MKRWVGLVGWPCSGRLTHKSGHPSAAGALRTTARHRCEVQKLTLSCGWAPEPPGLLDTDTLCPPSRRRWVQERSLELIYELWHCLELRSFTMCAWLQEIAVHSEEMQRTEQSNKSLQLEIKQLSTELRDVTVRHRMFPELFSSPSYRYSQWCWSLSL